jgi:hypothetical protein
MSDDLKEVFGMEPPAAAALGVRRFQVIPGGIAAKPEPEPEPEPDAIAEMLSSISNGIDTDPIPARQRLLGWTFC